MARIDLIALQQRLAQQPPTPVPAEPPSWSTRPAPATASAAAPAGTLRATTTMRTALPLKPANARADRAEERARANALRAQIDELKGEMAVASAEAERALAEERQRADRLNKQVEALSAKVVQAEKQVETAAGRAEQAEVGRDAERARCRHAAHHHRRAKAGQALMIEMHTRELALARQDILAAQQAAAELRSRRGPEGEEAAGPVQGGVAWQP